MFRLSFEPVGLLMTHQNPFLYLEITRFVQISLCLCCVLPLLCVVVKFNYDDVCFYAKDGPALAATLFTFSVFSTNFVSVNHYLPIILH